MKKIKLTGKKGKGKYALVDNENFEWLNQFGWCISGNSEYATASVNGKPLMMHRLLMNVKKEEHLDHINRNKLDNRKNNLRIATRSQNRANIIKYKNNSSGFKGVFFETDKSYVNKKWKATIRVNKKLLYLGRFKTKEEAAIIYNKMAKKHFGEFAYLNQIGGNI